jgi:hypothetical protein
MFAICILGGFGTGRVWNPPLHNRWQISIPDFHFIFRRGAVRDPPLVQYAAELPVATRAGLEPAPTNSRYKNIAKKWDPFLKPGGFGTRPYNNATDYSFVFTGFSLSNNHFNGLLTMYSRALANSFSSRITRS